MKKYITLAAALALCIILTGCCPPHDWQQATCTTPITCAKCGETEGEALGHTPGEANYQTAGICTRCGEPVGEPLTAEFAEKNVALSSAKGEYDYTTVCLDDESLTTCGKASLSSYYRVKSDEQHREKNGYEWIIAKIDISFSDENAQNSGIQANACIQDYYTDSQREKSLSEANGEGFRTYTVSNYAEDFNRCCSRCTFEWGDWFVTEEGGKTCVCTVTFELLVPEGYDGSVIGLYSAALKQPENGNIMSLYARSSDSFLLFRLK